MSNILKIHNFLIFEETQIEIKRFNVLIGPQASGKSVIAKLIYLFIHLPETVFLRLSQDEKIRELKLSMVKTFQEIFSESAWKEQSFSIEFITDVGTLSFEHEQNKKLSFQMDKEYTKLLKRIFHKKEISQLELNSDSMKHLKDVMDKEEYSRLEKNIKLQSLIHNEQWGFVNNGGSCIFIPAGRSFYAALENNIFSFLQNNVHIDYFLKQFGSEYSHAKFFFSNLLEEKEKTEQEKIQEDLINGVYIKKKDKKDYICYQKKDKVFDLELSFASSGQQEVLPLLLTLSKGSSTFFMIEEPEAHIFPKSQSDLIRYIVSKWDCQNDKEQAFLLTTHSPYILTAINNLVYAGILYKKYQGNKVAAEKLEKIYKENEVIPCDNLSAYLVHKGKAENIIDADTGMINAERLDSISDVIADKFSSLAEIELEMDKDEEQK